MPLSCMLALAIAASGMASPQDTIPNMTAPDRSRYDRFVRIQKDFNASIVSGAISPKWEDDSKSFTYERDGKTWKFDLQSLESTETGKAPTPKSKAKAAAAKKPERGRQFDTAISEDKKRKAVSRDRNIVISDGDGKNELQITTDGSVPARIKNGIASWVYGEELIVKEAMWWSPDASKLAFYRFDESQVKDYFLALDLTEVHDRLDVEPYPKAGQPNPRVEIFIYDVKSKRTLKVHAAFGDHTLAEYLYDIRWSKDGKWLFFNRSNRKQNVMEFCAADPATGEAHVIAREDQPNSWAENHPTVQFLKDNHRFVWSSEKDGYKNFYMRDLSRIEIVPLTHEKSDVRELLAVDEEAGVLIYTAPGGDNPYFNQLYTVKLDGSGKTCLTDPKLSHQVSLAPDHTHFVDVAQSYDTPAEARLLDLKGALVKVIATSDTTKFDKLKLQKTQMFTYKAADGVTDLYGTLQFPANFDPSKKYPLLVGVYGGPESGGLDPRFAAPSPLTELGYLVANFAGRGTSSRGKAFRAAVYEKLGDVEIADQAAGVKFLRERSYIDGKRVGIHGTSYGGYASTMALLQYSDVFAAACASSSVTAWYNYDSIYTERYMGLPTEEDNAKGYESSQAIKFIKGLKGRLLLFYGTADNNVHAANTLQLVKVLHKENRVFEMMVGPDTGHTQIPMANLIEFFDRNLRP